MNQATMQLRREMRDHALNWREASRCGWKLFAESFRELAIVARNQSRQLETEERLKATLKRRVAARLQTLNRRDWKMAAANDR